MYTSFVYFALAGVFANASIAEEPLLHKNYGLARMQSVGANKPIAVFIGSGEGGWKAISKEGQLAKDVRKTLSADYVCVYVDMSQGAGKELAGAFEVTQAPGLVISDRKASLQAFHHEGSLSNVDLERCLKRYADPILVVQATETKAPAQKSYASSIQQPSQRATGNYGYAPIFRGSRGC